MYYVYIIQAERDVFKIGISHDYKERLNDLKTNHYKQLTIVGFSSFNDREIAQKAEKIIHRKFRKQRIRGEWFKISLKELLKNVGLSFQTAEGKILNEKHHEDLLFFEEIKNQPKKIKIKRFATLMGDLISSQYHGPISNEELEALINCCQTANWNDIPWLEKTIRSIYNIQKF